MNKIPGYETREKDEAVRQDARESLAKDTHSHLTLCEQLRFVYDVVADIEDQEIKKQILDKLVDPFLLAKKMVLRLQYYKKKYKDETGSNGRSIRRLYKYGERRRWRERRTL